MENVKSITMNYPVVEEYDFKFKKSDHYNLLILLPPSKVTDKSKPYRFTIPSSDNLQNILSLSAAAIVDHICELFNKYKSTYGIRDMRKNKCMVNCSIELDDNVETLIGAKDWEDFSEAMQSFLGVTVIYGRHHIGSFYNRTTAKNVMEIFTTAKTKYFINIPLYKLKTKVVDVYYKDHPLHIIMTPTSKSTLIQYNLEKGEIYYDERSAI